MKRLLLSLLFAPLLSLAATPESLWKELGQKGDVVEVEVYGSPTPVMAGYDQTTSKCQLLINKNVQQPEGTVLLVVIAHEAGHCEAIERKLQVPGELTRYGEAFGDVYALAWISKHHPDLVDSAYSYLMSVRKESRRISNAYDTLFPLHMALVSLPSTKSPVDFTVDLLK